MRRSSASSCPRVSPIGAAPAPTRFFRFTRLDEDWLARTLVALLNLRPPFRLCLDRTNWKLLLVLCILWSVFDHGGSSNTTLRTALMQRYLAIFGAGSIAVLLADREFIGNQWFEFLVENDIPFAIRGTYDLIAALDDGRVAPRASLTKRKSALRHLTRCRGRFRDVPERFAGALGFAAKRSSDGEMIIVVTNRQPDRALAD
ncbi:hypothetical protein SAMN04488498_13313 [Mesorhizobium albiziae]|uniref:Transposase DDE domain-containing protein n=1 Tax=Neomesorhizobium albiziae TaxID=335020 RepID=A0A1I4F3D4_9HYPH|nr:hypothetical protein [Mesorhizobium albiziae]GLS33094.1 hypothetical protein GCM10007937_48050 [Mesorhizobium albiziae]SFL10901.1 hypothetical protein SAMN04488498_13313 [Mesorhizobium albiziae]